MYIEKTYHNFYIFINFTYLCFLVSFLNEAAILLLHIESKLSQNKIARRNNKNNGIKCGNAINGERTIKKKFSLIVICLFFILLTMNDRNNKRILNQLFFWLHIFLFFFCEFWSHKMYFESVYYVREGFRLTQINYSCAHFISAFILSSSWETNGYVCFR